MSRKINRPSSDIRNTIISEDIAIVPIGGGEHPNVGAVIKNTCLLTVQVFVPNLEFYDLPQSHVLRHPLMEVTRRAGKLWSILFNVLVSIVVCVSTNRR